MNPSVAEIEAVLTDLAKQCKRSGRLWRHYESTHREINHLLDDRERQVENDKVLTPIRPVD